jgi:iron complex transport system substrate-binding protein
MAIAALRLVRAVLRGGILCMLLVLAPSVSRSTAPLAGHPAMVDALGDTLPAGPYPRRIISLSPSVTEILFALGVDSARVVGVTRFCDVPELAKTRPSVGGIVDPSLEEIVARRPDLVLAVRGNPVEILHRIRSLGIPVFAFEDRTGLDGVQKILDRTAELVGPDDVVMSDSLRGRFREEMRLYKSWSDSIPDDRKPVVYYADPEFPAWTAGPGSHVDDLISLAGGRNLVKEPSGWPQFSAEALLVRQPQVLLLAQPAGADREALRARLLALPGWSGLTALKEGRICWIDSGTLLRPGPRLLRALEELAACLHPERSGPRR